MKIKILLYVIIFTTITFFLLPNHIIAKEIITIKNGELTLDYKSLKVITSENKNKKLVQIETNLIINDSRGNGKGWAVYINASNQSYNNQDFKLNYYADSIILIDGQPINETNGPFTKEGVLLGQDNGLIVEAFAGFGMGYYSIPIKLELITENDDLEQMNNPNYNVTFTIGRGL